MKKLLGLIALSITAAAGYLILAPSPIDPVAWDAPVAPAMSGVLAVNNDLQDAELLAQGKLDGPEDTAVDAQGRVYAGLHNGKIVRITADGTVATFADTKAGRWAWTLTCKAI